MSGAMSREERRRAQELEEARKVRLGLRVLFAASAFTYTNPSFSRAAFVTPLERLTEVLLL